MKTDISEPKADTVSEIANAGERVTELHEKDVLFGRNSKAMKHPGNCEFRRLIAVQADDYNNSRSRHFKSAVAVGIVEKVLLSGGRFLKEDVDNSEWYVVDMATAVDKVAHAMRDLKRKKKNKLGRMFAAQEAIAIARARAVESVQKTKAEGASLQSLIGLQPSPSSLLAGLNRFQTPATSLFSTGQAIDASALLARSLLLPTATNPALQYTSLAPLVSDPFASTQASDINQALALLQAQSSALELDRKVRQQQQQQQQEKLLSVSTSALLQAAQGQGKILSNDSLLRQFASL